MTIDIVIAARAGSKGIYRKNTMLLAGKPLIEYTLEAALGVTGVRNIFLSTDDAELLDIYKGCGRIKLIKRPKKLSGDGASVRDVLSHAAKAAGAGRPDLLLLLFPTAPLRTARDLDNAIQFARTLPDFDSVVGVTRTRISPFGGLSLDKSKNVKYLSKYGGRYYRRQDQPTSYRLNGALFIVRTDRIRKINDLLISGNSYGYEMDEISSVDIDTPFDVAVAEAIISFRKECISHSARGGFNVQRIYICDDQKMGIRRNVLDAAAYERHFMRYKMLLNHIRHSDDVLDIACGSGYGSEILSTRAKTVLGVDGDPKTIEYANHHHKRKNTKFTASSIEAFNPKRRFDKIISVETIEHLADPEGYLVRAKRWLKPGGAIWLTCPLSETNSNDIENPFHISAITYEWLNGMMGKYYKKSLFYDLSSKDIFAADTLNNRISYIIACGIV